METPSDFNTMPAVFGHWKTAPSPSPDDRVSFGVSSPDADENIVVWRLNLSADPAQADQQLRQVENETSVAQAKIEAIPGTLDHLVQQQQDHQQPSQQVSFSTLADDPTIGVAEADMLQMLEEVKVRTQSGSREQMASYGLLGSNDGWSQASEQIQTMANRLLHMVTHMAWIETSIQDVLLGRTVIGWTGDARTLWGADAGTQQFNQHRRSLRLALASRHMLMRTLTVTAQGATKIATLLAIPGGPVLALPVVWKYVNRVLSEVRQYQDVVGKTNG